MSRFTSRPRRKYIPAAIVVAGTGARVPGDPISLCPRADLAQSTCQRDDHASHGLGGHRAGGEISGDGRWVAFLADHDGQMDAWVTKDWQRNLSQPDTWQPERVGFNPSIRTLGFSADNAQVTVWTRGADGSRPEDVKLLAVATAGGELRDYLPGIAEVAWSHGGNQSVYHTTAPGDPLFVRDARGVTREIYVAPAGVHCHFPLWSADDAYIYFARGIPPGDWDIWRIRPSGEELERITFHDSQLSHPVLLDQHTLVYLAKDRQGSGPWLYALNIEQTGCPIDQLRTRALHIAVGKRRRGTSGCHRGRIELRYLARAARRHTAGKRRCEPDTVGLVGVGDRAVSAHGSQTIFFMFRSAPVDRASGRRQMAKVRNCGAMIAEPSRARLRFLRMAARLLLPSRMASRRSCTRWTLAGKGCMPCQVPPPARRSRLGARWALDRVRRTARW